MESAAFSLFVITSAIERVGGSSSSVIAKISELSELTYRDYRKMDLLFEELLLGDNPQKTIHDKIYKAQDPFIPYDQLKRDLDKLSALLEDNKVSEVIDMLTKLVPLYHEKSKNVDSLYKEQLNLENNINEVSIIKNHDRKVVRLKT